MRYFIYLGCLSVLLWQQAVFAEAYRWTDAAGQVHFSQTPPASADVEYDEIETREREAPQTDKNSDGDKEDGDGDESDKHNKFDDEVVKLTPQQIKIKNCNSAQKRLHTLQANPTVAKTDKDGKPQVLSAEQRQAEIVQAQSSVNNYCAVIESEE